MEATLMSNMIRLTLKLNKVSLLLFFLLVSPLYSNKTNAASCPAQMADYIAYPPFLTSKVAPNVLLILDNSGSMNNFAYREVSGLRCSSTQAWTGYNPGTEYYGLFNPNKCYRYDNSAGKHYFYVDGNTIDDPLTPTITERSTGSNPLVKKFSGNWLNWFTMRRLDVAKKVLTGGRIAPNTTDTVLEGMPTDSRDTRRIYDDYTPSTDPNSPTIMTGSFTKNVYYTPFHQGFYSYFFNVDRNDHLGGSPNQFAIMFNVVTATFDATTDIAGTTCVDVPYTDLTVPTTPTDNGNNTGETGYSHNGYVVAVKVETADLPIQGIVQKMAGRVRFGYMQFNYGVGPGDGYARNTIATHWDIDGDGTNDLTWRYADGGRVRNYIGDTSTTTDPHGTTVSEIVNNINQQNIQMFTPLEEVLWEATRYFQQITPQFRPEDSPDTPPANSVDFEISNTWDPYYYNNLNMFIPCAKSYIIFVSDGAGNYNSGRPTANWPAGANTTDLTGDSSYSYLDDIAFNMHTQDLRDDTAMGELTDSIDQVLTLYTVFCFDDSNTAKAEMMKAARAGGFIDLNGDGDTGGTVSDTNPAAFVGDPEWDIDGNNIPDTYFEAQNGALMEEMLMRAIADILSRTSSGTAASVISNSQSGEGAIYQAVFFTESEAEPLTANTVKWNGNIHALMIDSMGNMREDSNNNATLDENSDKIILFDPDTAKADLYTPPYDPDASPPQTPTKPNVEMSDVNFLWDAHSKLKSTTLDITNQRTYSNNPTPFQRYIFTDYIDTSSPVSLGNVDSTKTMEFVPGVFNDSTNDNYFFLNSEETGYSEANTIAEAQNIVKFIRGEEKLTQTVTNIPYRNRTLDTDGDGTDDTVFRLGDVVHSTPTVVSRPSENYDLLYRDHSYLEYKKLYNKRRTVVYAGANDGMLHAFNGGFYDQDTKSFLLRPKIWSGTAWVPDASKTDFSLGTEIWGYIPNAVLPHLKWLKESLSENVHTYYVDLKPRVFDAKIFATDAVHPNGWGTVLIGGLRLGGGPIGVDTNNDGTCDLNFSSVYFALDITNPETPPQLLWSFSDPNLGFTTNYPTPIRIGSKWFIIIGSGPKNYDAICQTTSPIKYGGSDQTASLYVIDAVDGSLKHTFTLEGHSFAADPIAVDFDLKTTESPVSPLNREWTGEAIYLATDGSDSGNEGKVFRIKTTKINGDPEETPANWTKTLFFDPNTIGSDQHINTALSVAQDDSGRFWLYFGTGRFWGSTDREPPYFSYQNSFYGIKEPVDSSENLTYATVTTLKDVTGVQIINNSTVANHDALAQASFNSVKTLVEAKEGWYRDFETTGERNLGQAAIIGDLLTFSTFVPDNDLCSSEGESYLYALHYQTGTSYWKEIFPGGTNPLTNAVTYRLKAGKGYSTTPNIHTGGEEGSAAFLQTSTGAIIKIEQKNPGITKSGGVYWRESSGN